MPPKDEIAVAVFRTVITIQTGGDDLTVVRDVRLLHPELSRGELADIFGPRPMSCAPRTMPVSS
jgi:hypothetical protein